MKHKLPSDLDWRLLTPREYKIAWLLHHGLSYAAIGRDFNVSGDRISGIWRRAMSRLGHNWGGPNRRGTAHAEGRPVMTCGPTGKQSFSRSDALRKLHELQRTQDEAAHLLNVYRCPHCGRHHVGHRRVDPTQPKRRLNV